MRLIGRVGLRSEQNGRSHLMPPNSSSSVCVSTFTSGGGGGGGGDGDGGGGGGVNCIEHRVSKMDTLAGVAIKYGVEVVDIKRMNGLATDLQMFALKSLQIPLLRRHPPSPTPSNGSASPREQNNGRPQPGLRQGNSFESFQSLKTKSPQLKVSPAMSTLQNYYGLKFPNLNDPAEGTEMAFYGTGNGVCASVTEGKEVGNEKYVRRQQNSDPELESSGTEMLLKEENSGGSSSSFSPNSGKGLAMRPKSIGRHSPVADPESGSLHDPLLTSGGYASVQKSLSTPSLLDQDWNNSSFVWLTSKWSLKPDLQAFSATTIAKPVFDGVAKPIINGRRNKAALD